MGGWDKLGSDYKEQMIAWLKEMPASDGGSGAGSAGTHSLRR
jgi:hypothetical protein